MNIPNKRIFDILFLLIAVVEILAHVAWEDSHPIHYFSKPALLAALMLFFYANTTHSRNTPTTLFLLALFASWIGDIVLLFQQHHLLYFILGLVSFLVAHVLYIIVFVRLQNKSRQTSLIARKPWLAGLVFIYGGTFYALLYPTLSALALPVAVYTLVISIMAIMAINCSGYVSHRAFLFLVGGALCFLISDSSLAINKFGQSFSYASVLIMGTYIAAQYLLTMGYLIHAHEAK
jgi:uncharacterized membrane protein YhhN